MKDRLRALTLSVFLLPSVLGGQGRASKLVDAAFRQLNARNLDSAETLLRPVVDSMVKATPVERAAALMLLGVVDFYRGRDSAAASDFRASLAYSLALKSEWLSRVDSSLGVLWRREHGRAVCGSSDLDSGGHVVVDDSPALEEKPKVLSGPRVTYPEELRRAGKTGRVLLAAIIDTSGHAEPGSIKVVDGSHPDFNLAARRYLERARFQAGAVDGHPVRVCVEVPIDFKITGWH